VVTGFHHIYAMIHLTGFKKRPNRHRFHSAKMLWSRFFFGFDL